MTTTGRAQRVNRFQQGVKKGVTGLVATLADAAQHCEVKTTENTYRNVSGCTTDAKAQVENVKQKYLEFAKALRTAKSGVAKVQAKAGRPHKTTSMQGDLLKGRRDIYRSNLAPVINVTGSPPKTTAKPVAKSRKTAKSKKQAAIPMATRSANSTPSSFNASSRSSGSSMSRLVNDTSPAQVAEAVQALNAILNAPAPVSPARSSAKSREFNARSPFKTRKAGAQQVKVGKYFRVVGNNKVYLKTQGKGKSVAVAA